MQNYRGYQVNLSNCDKEPIHLIGRIQPHGFLLVLDKDTFRIEQVSQNISAFLPVASPAEILGTSLQEFLAENETPFDPRLLLEPDHVDPNIISLAGRRFFGFSFLSEEKVILECEPFQACPDIEMIKQSYQLSHLHQRLSTLQTVENLGHTVAEVVREYLDYQRVQVLQFDPDWHSSVIAESRQDNLGSYLGHHFPATDIPEAARALLLEKPVRQIPDVHAQAVEIIPYDNPATGLPTPILKSELRNPSEIHLEYVRNMGVAATISFSVIVKGSLWGLITCQNQEPIFIDAWKRQLGVLITQTFAGAVAAVQEKRDVKQYAVFKSNEQAYIASLRQHGDLLSGLSQSDRNPMNFTEGSGAALVLQKEVISFGLTPTGPQIKDLINWLIRHTEDKMYSTRKLSEQFPEAEAYQEVASGLLALEISRYNQEYLLFFKPEIKETRVWAGDPVKPSIGKGLRLHPRKSFEKWEEVIKGNSLPWSTNEVEIAQFFVKDLTALRLSDQATKLGRLNAQLETTAQLLAQKNTQLKDFAAIMSHNLRSPLANIKGLQNLYKDEPNAENAAFVLDRIQEVAGNMSQTISDLNLILKTELQKQLPREEVDLETIIQKEVQNLGAVVMQTEAEIKTELQVFTLCLPKLYVESILHNLISNALKYRSPGRRPQVMIKSWQESDGVHLTVTDNGLGMDLEKVGHKIFGLYKTFHRHEQAKGVGLYLTKIQVESLGGQVSVQSELGKGTTFTVSFPINA